MSKRQAIINGLKEFGGIALCSFIGHKTQEIYEDDEEWCKANPDKDLEIKCVRCGDSARLYWSIKAKKLKAYQPNMDAGPTNPIFGDIDRDNGSVYPPMFSLEDGKLPPLFEYHCATETYRRIDNSE
jgi:hypothetical protein